MKIKTIELYIRKSDDESDIYCAVSSNSEEDVWIHCPIENRWESIHIKEYIFSSHKWRRVR